MKAEGQRPTDTPAHLELIERFEAAYNAIDRFLRHKLGRDNHAPFSALLESYWPDRNRSSVKVELRSFGDLRNVLVHSKVRPNQHLATPALWVVERIERIRDEMTSPGLAIPTFQRAVRTVRTTDILFHVLTLIRQCDYSQFPVYDEGKDDRFRGLLTENGITRWLAHYVDKAQQSLERAGKVAVKNLLGEEEHSRNYQFICRSAPVDELILIFAKEPLVEAVLITETGKRTEKLLGLATRWDILRHGERR
jgi:predicted transcriptional regulator